MISFRFYFRAGRAPHRKHQRAAFRHVLLHQKRLRQLLPVEGDLLLVDVLGVLVFDLDGEGLFLDGGWHWEAGLLGRGLFVHFQFLAVPIGFDELQAADVGQVFFAAAAELV